MTTKTRPTPKKNLAKELAGASSREHHLSQAVLHYRNYAGASRLRELVFAARDAREVLRGTAGATPIGVAQQMYAELLVADPSWRGDQPTNAKKPRDPSKILADLVDGAKLDAIASTWPTILERSAGWRTSKACVSLLVKGEDELTYALPTEHTEWVKERLIEWDSGKLTRDKLLELVRHRNPKKRGTAPSSPEDAARKLAAKSAQDGANRIRNAIADAEPDARAAAMKQVLGTIAGEGGVKPDEVLTLTLTALIEQFTAEAVQASLTRLSKRRKAA